MRIESIKRSPLASGKSELLAHMQGETTSRAEAMKAKCFECCNGYIDGKVDCGIPDCPLYPWMPFNSSGVRAKAGGSTSATFGRSKTPSGDETDIS